MPPLQSRDERRLQKPVEAGPAVDKLRLLCGMKAFQSYSEAAHAAQRHGGGLRCRKARLVVAGPAKARRHTSANTMYSISPDCVDPESKGFDPYSTALRQNYLKTLAFIFVFFIYFLPNLST